MRRKAKRNITDAPQLDYISPWRHVDTSRDQDYILSKTKIIEEIILPAQQQMERQKRAENSQTQNYSPSLKKTTRTMNTTQSDSKQKHLRKSWIHSAHIQQLYLADKNKKKNAKELFQRIIFVRKDQIVSNVRIISLGSESQENILDEQLFKKRYSLVHKKLGKSKEFQESPKLQLSQKQYAKQPNYRDQFKRLNVTLLSKLKHSGQLKEREATQKLNKTLKQFMIQQGQV